MFYTYEDSGECSGACNWNCIHQMEKTVEDEFKEIEKSVLIEIGCGAWQLQMSMENASRFNNHWQFIVKKHIWP